MKANMPYRLRFGSLARRIVGLPRRTKKIVMLVADSVAMPVCLAISLWLVMPGSSLWALFWPWVACAAIALYLFRGLGLYRSIVRFVGVGFTVVVVKGVTILAIGVAVTVAAVNSTGLALKISVVFWLVAAAYLCGSRLAVKLFLQAGWLTGDRVIIYGAGNAGTQLASAISRGGRFTPVAFVDDSPSVYGTVINGLEIYSPDTLPRLIKSLGVARVLLALPSTSRRQRQRIIGQLEKFPVHVQSMPAIDDLISGNARSDELVEVDVADLLGRAAVPSIDGLLDACIRDKSVMVTGAGGSIGSELCLRIARLAPKRLIIFELSEVALYKIDQKLRNLSKRERFGLEIVPLIGSVHHKDRMLEILRAYKVNTIYHAAAYKHVPLVEHNMIEGIRNNVFGTLYAAEAAMESEVSSFVLVSTDKAVLPTNVMGATKRLSELVLQGLNDHGGRTNFSIVRFGNVLASSGSVVPLFRQQIRDGGPVTVTHPKMHRYFMTISEAAELVIQAGSMATGGDVFVLDMGASVRIVDLAKKMIHLMGLTVKDAINHEGDIEISYIGLRPAEKLYEELLIGGNVSGTDHPSILRAEEAFLAWNELQQLLERLWNACLRMDCEEARELLLVGVQGYTPKTDLVDLVWRERNGPVVADTSGVVTTLKRGKFAS